MESNKSGGLLVGATDKNGEEGIQVVSPSGDRIIRMGGGESVINEASTKKHCELLSEINQDGGGVPLPCAIKNIANTTESQMEIQDVIKMNAGGNIPKSAIKEGTKAEQQEHRDTILRIKNDPNISVKKSAELIARDHLKESPQYYKKLKEMEANLSHGGKISDEQAEMIWLLKTEGPRSFNDSINESIANDLVGKGLVNKNGNEYGLTKKGEIEMMVGGGKIKSSYDKLVYSKEFKNWFGDWEKNPKGSSKVVDKKGYPLVVYHGTGTQITEFKPEYTGQGNDQIGSGFYFTSEKSQAEAYTTATQTSQPKLGGTDNPNVIEAFLSIQNPIRVNGMSLKDSDMMLSKSQAIAMLKLAPNIYDKDETPLNNWEDTSGGVSEALIKRVAENYVGESLVSLENDFYKYDATAFREAIRKVTGKDGVIQDFGDYQHYVAWFPTQIKLADGTNTKFDPKNPDVRFYRGGELSDKSTTTMHNIVPMAEPQTNDTQTCKCKTMEYHEKLTACQKDKLGDKHLGEGTAVKDTKTGVVSDIKSIEHRGFKLLPQSSFDHAPRQEFFVPFEEFVEKFEAGLIDVSGYQHTDEDHKLMHFIIKDIIACNIIKEKSKQLEEIAEIAYEDVVIEPTFAGGGIIGEIKANKKGEIKEIRDVNGSLLKQVHVGDTTYVRNVEDKNYRNTNNDLLMKFDSAGIHMAYGGIVGVEQTPNYYRVDISSPRKVSTCRTPKWASNVAESVKSGAKVVTCKKYKDWFISSVLVPKDGITEGGAKEIASEIKDKIQNKKMANGGIILESGAVSEKVDNLILFADNTRNIAEMRDSVYDTIESRIKRGGKPTVAEIAERFNTMLLKTRGQYVREMGNTADARESVDLSEKEQDEFKILYAMDFPNWLKEKHRKNISSEVAEYVSSLYETKLYSGGEVRGAMEIDYDKVRAIKYWGELKPKQRLHFLIDHADEYLEKPLSELIGTKEFADYKKLSSAHWTALPSGVQGSIENHVIMGTYSSGGSMATGGAIPNNYAGKKYSEVWDSWNHEQKKHFLLDHLNHTLMPNRNEDAIKKITSKSSKEIADIIYSPNSIRDGVDYGDIHNYLITHVEQGQYSSGGSMKNGGEVEMNGYTSTNPEIEQYLKDDVDATTKGLLVLIECTTDEGEKENLRKRLSESN